MVIVRGSGLLKNMGFARAKFVPIEGPVSGSSWIASLKTLHASRTSSCDPAITAGGSFSPSRKAETAHDASCAQPLPVLQPPRLRRDSNQSLGFSPAATPAKDSRVRFSEGMAMTAAVETADSGKKTSARTSNPWSIEILTSSTRTFPSARTMRGQSCPATTLHPVL